MTSNSIQKTFLAIFFLWIIFLGASIHASTAAKNYKAFQVSESSKIVFYLGGGSPLTTDNLTELKNILENVGGYEIDYRTSIGSYGDLRDAKLLVLLGNTVLYNISDFIIQFVSEGGSLLLVPPKEDFKDAKDIMKIFGTDLISEFAKDNESFIDVNTTILLKGTWDSSHPIFSGVNSIIIPNSYGFNFTNISLQIPFERYKLIWGGNTTTLKDFVGSNVTLGVAIELFTNSRIVFLGSYEIFENKYVLKADNGRFAYNLFKWLCSDSAKLLIQNVYVSKTKIYIGENETVYVNFTVVDENGSKINVTAKIYIFRPGDNNPIMTINASQIGEGLFEANIDLSQQKSGILEVWVSVHRRYYGYTTSKVADITLVKKLIYRPLIDPFLLTIYVLIPAIITLYAIIRFYPKYKENRKVVEGVEEKTK